LREIVRGWVVNVVVIVGALLGFTDDPETSTAHPFAHCQPCECNPAQA
jgi:hypothetical protein